MFTTISAAGERHDCSQAGGYGPQAAGPQHQEAALASACVHRPRGWPSPVCPATRRTRPPSGTKFRRSGSDVCCWCRNLHSIASSGSTLTRARRRRSRSTSRSPRQRRPKTMTRRTSNSQRRARGPQWPRQPLRRLRTIDETAKSSASRAGQCGVSSIPARYPCIALVDRCAFRTPTLRFCWRQVAITEKSSTGTNCHSESIACIISGILTMYIDSRYIMVGFPNCLPSHLLSTRDRSGQPGKSRKETEA